MVTTLLLKAIAYKEFTHALEIQGISYLAIDSRPTPFNSILWTANIDIGDAYLIGDYSFFDTHEIKFTSYPKNHNFLGELANADKVERLIAVTENWYTVNKKEGKLLFNDLRFGLISLDPNESRFAFSYELNQTETGLNVVETPKFNRDAERLLSALWERIWGN